jgi:hypothetical protein
MGSLVQLGTVPEWVQAAAEAGALYMAIRGRWQQQAIDWAKELKRLSGMTTHEVRQVVEDSPALAELVGLAWEEAARSASEDKRRLLAKVVAAALRGDAAAEDLDDLQFLLRAVIALDPAHVTLLVVIATPRAVQQAEPDERVYHSVRIGEMRDRWPGPPDLMSPALAALEREGLIRRRENFQGLVLLWELRPYGRRFFDFLERAGEAQSSTPSNP